MVKCGKCIYYQKFETWDRDSQEMCECYECRRLRDSAGYHVDFGAEGYCCLGDDGSDE